MDKALIVARLTPIFHDIFDNDSVQIRESLCAKDVPEWDSLSNVRLFVAIEQAFGVRFSSGEITGLQNVGEILELLTKKGV